MINFEVDQGTAFGRWGDPVSQFMYEESLRDMLPRMQLDGLKVGDYGGANGILKDVVGNVTTIDIDARKGPDIVDDILLHTGKYDVAFCRYVMHYLSDQQVIAFVENALRYCDRLYLVQFTNDGTDLRAKYATSKGEGGKYFRTQSQLESLLPVNAKRLYSASYAVGPEFYCNRLGLVTDIRHEETVRLYEVQG